MGLYRKYYLKMANKKEEWTIYKTKNKEENKEDSEKYLIHPFNIKKYSTQQKIHYFFTIIMIIFVNILAFESYFNGYTKLYFNYNYKELIYVPRDVAISLFINTTVFYLYHRLAHTKYLYKYIHR